MLKFQFFHNKFFAFLLGMLSAISQVILLREFVTVFYGNETSYAVILGSWLFWIALGSFTVSYLTPRIQKVSAWFVSIQIALFFLVPGTLVAARLGKLILGVHVGEIIGFVPMGVLTFFLLAPVTFLLGAVYVLICHMPLPQELISTEDKISGIYFSESLGAGIGGLLFSFLLIHFIPALNILWFVGFMSLLVSFSAIQSKLKRRVLCSIFAVLIVGGFVGGGVNALDRWSRAQQWKGLDLVTVEDSIYGNIAIAQVDQEYSLFENGLLSFSSRDSFASEELIHYAMLSHPNPRQILVIGTGLDGSLDELLKYSSVHIDFIQIDPKVIMLTKATFPAPHWESLKSSQVSLIYQDARFFIQKQQKKYDLVLINMSDPFTAVINRYYTREFFQEVKKDLNPKGILALSVSSSENYLSNENRAYLQAMHSTLASVFAEVKSIPGDTNIFLSSQEANFIRRDPEFLIDRIRERGIENQYVDRHYIPYKLSADRIAYIDNILNVKGRINTDANPIAYFFDIVLWSTHFNQSYKNLIGILLRVDVRYLFLFPLVILIFAILFFRKKKTSPITVSIFSTGFSEIVFQIIVIISFQSLYGYAYYRIGVIIAAFMLGLAFGSKLAGKLIKANGNLYRLYKITQAGIVLYPLLLIGIYVIFKRGASTDLVRNILSIIYSFLPLIAGFMGGMQYPLANRILQKSYPGQSSHSTVAGFLYAFDVLGASLGAIISAAFLIPLIGIYAMALWTAAINFSIFLWMNLVEKK